MSLLGLIVYCFGVLFLTDITLRLYLKEKPIPKKRSPR